MPNSELVHLLSKPSTPLAYGKLPTLAEVCQPPASLVPTLDVEILNMICAFGLPGAESLDPGKVIAWIDEAAWKVDLVTRSRLDEFIENPALYDHSPAKFCCEYLLRTLQELLGVRYNPARAIDADFQNPACNKPDFRNAHDLFIHGMIDGPGGTCASMPVLYAAVGRRRDYPLKLVEAPAHLFLRWDDREGKKLGVSEVINIEGTGHGISFPLDEYYRTSPRDWTRAEKNADWYLKSMSPEEELAAFLTTRGSCLEDNGRIEEALDAYKWATQLAPDDLRYKGKLCALLNSWYETRLKAMADQSRLLEAAQLTFQRAPRQPELIMAGPAGPLHGGTCQCFQCKQARQSAQQPLIPGHPLGCGCFNCQNRKTNAFSLW